MRIKYDYKVEHLNKEGKVVSYSWMKSKKAWLEDYENRINYFPHLKGQMNKENSCGFVLCEDGTIFSYTRQVRGEN